MLAQPKDAVAPTAKGHDSRHGAEVGWITISYRRPSHRTAQATHRRQSTDPAHSRGSKRRSTAAAARHDAVLLAANASDLHDVAAAAEPDTFAPLQTGIERESLTAGAPAAPVTTSVQKALDRALNDAVSRADAHGVQELMTLLSLYHTRFAHAARELAHDVRRSTAPAPDTPEGPTPQTTPTPRSYSQATQAHRPGATTTQMQQKHEQAVRNRARFMSSMATRLRGQTEKVNQVRSRQLHQRDEIKRQLADSLQEKQRKAVANRAEHLKQIQARGGSVAVSPARETPPARLAAEQKLREAETRKHGQEEERIRRQAELAAMQEAATERRRAAEHDRQQRVLRELAKHRAQTEKNARDRADALAAKAALHEEKSRRRERFKQEKEAEEAEMRRELQLRLERASERYGERIEQVKVRAAAANEQAREVALRGAGASSPGRPPLSAGGAAAGPGPAAAPVPPETCAAGTPPPQEGTLRAAPARPSSAAPKRCKKHRARLAQLCAAFRSTGSSVVSADSVGLDRPVDKRLAQVDSLARRLPPLLETAAARLAGAPAGAPAPPDSTLENALSGLATVVRDLRECLAGERPEANAAAAAAFAGTHRGTLVQIARAVSSIDSQQVPVFPQEPVIQLAQLLRQLCDCSPAVRIALLTTPAGSDAAAAPVSVDLVRMALALLEHCAPAADLTLRAASELLDLTGSLLDSAEADPPALAPIRHALVAFVLAAHVLERLRNMFLIAHGPLAPETPLGAFLAAAMRFLRRVVAAAEIPATDSPATFAPSVRDALVDHLAAGELVGSLTMLDALILYKGPSAASREALPPPAAETELCLVALQFFNHVALAEPALLRRVLAAGVVQTEFFHFASFWLRCYHQHPPADSRDPLAALVDELILLVGIYCAGNPQAQALLRWGPAPVILQHLVNMPFAYFHQQRGRGVLLPTLVAATLHDDANRAIVEEEVSSSLLAHYLREASSESVPFSRWALSLRVAPGLWDDAVGYFSA